MEQDSAGYAGEKAAGLRGLSPAAAKEYLFGFVSTLKLTEKQAEGLDAELGKWASRIELAKSRGRPDLAQEAEKELEEIKKKRQQLAAEISELKLQIEEMRKEPFGADLYRNPSLLAARERSIDPDLLEQELLMAAGHLPGEEAKVRGDRVFSEMEKDAAAEAALSELKAKMKR
jgi:phage shock protein A